LPSKIPRDYTGRQNLLSRRHVKKSAIIVQQTILARYWDSLPERGRRKLARWPHGDSQLWL